MVANRTIRIEFPTEPDGPSTHQVRNFGEDIWREIEQTKLGDVGGLATVDQATDCLEVKVFHTRKIGTVQKLVSTILKRHLLSDRSKVTYV